MNQEDKKNYMLELNFAVYGAIVLLKEYASIHIRRKEPFYIQKPFNELKSLKRLKKKAKELDNLLSEYSKHLLDN